MQSSFYRILSVAITLLLVAALGALLILTLRSQPATVIVPLPTPTATATTMPTATPTPAPALVAEIVVDAAGYKFQPLAGFAVSIQESVAKLTGTAPDLPVAPSIVMDAGPNAAFGMRAGQTLEDVLAQYADVLVRQGDVAVGPATAQRVAGQEAIGAPLTGEEAGQPIAGRIVVAQPDENHLFVTVATAPVERWEAATSAELDAVLASVQFFAPDATPTALAEVAPPATATITATAPAATATSLPTVRATATITGVTILSPTATAPAITTTLPVTPLITLPTPLPAISPVAPQPEAAALEWQAVSDSNFMNDLVISGNTVWIASDGGALAWTRGSTTPVKFTSVDGLAGTRLTAVADCALPEFGVVFGSDSGLQVVDPRAGGWQLRDSANSELSYDDVSALACDAEAGYLVVGYARHGIDIYDAAEDEWRHLDRSSGLASNNVTALAVVGDLDEIWVVSNDGVTVAAGPDSTFYDATNSQLESNRIGSIAVDADGAVWLGGDGALYRVEGETWTVFSAEEVGDAGFPLRLIAGLTPADNGTLWLGDIDGAVCRFDPAESRCVAAFTGAQGMAAGPLTRLALDAAGRVYYTTAGDGYSVLDGDAWRRFARAGEAVRGNAIGAATVDGDGALWLATDAGIQRVEGADRPPTLAPAGDIDPAAVRVLLADSTGLIWAGGDGAASFDGETWTVYTTTAGLAGETVQAIAEDSRGRIWLGTDRGISIWNGATFFNLTEETGLPSADIRSLLAEGDAMWIGSDGGGLYRFERNQLQVLTSDNVDLPSDTVTALAPADDGSLLVGTDSGLAELRDGSSAPIPAAGEGAISHILALPGSLWVATADDGLYFDAGDGWQHATAATVLPADQVTALVAADESIWVGGRTGGLVLTDIPQGE